MSTRFVMVDRNTPMLLISVLEKEVQRLMQKAENADNVPLDDGLTVPDEIARRQDRIAKLEEAKRIIDARFEERKHQAEENKRQGRTRKNRIPRKKGQLNFTDPESRIMMSKDGYIQAWNAQVAVDTEGSMLIVGQRLTEHGNDQMELVPSVQAVESQARKPSYVLAGNGFFSEVGIMEGEKAKTDGGTRLRNHQRGYGVSAFPSERENKGVAGMDTRDCGV